MTFIFGDIPLGTTGGQHGGSVYQFVCLSMGWLQRTTGKEGRGGERKEEGRKRGRERKVGKKENKQERKERKKMGGREEGVGRREGKGLRQKRWRLLSCF